LADGPLSGIRVLDLSRLLPGPYCSLVLSDLGADVVKVEDPDPGDYLRDLSPEMFAALNRGKRSIVLDLKAEPAALRPLCAAADVLIESFRPGVLERLVPWALSEFPRLIVCRISGFGQSGAWRDRAGHDVGYLALSGALARAGAMPGVQIADLAGGFTAVSAILAALYERSRTGRGRVLDVSATGAATQFVLAADQPNVLDGTRPCYRVYACKEGRFALGALEPKFWHRFCAAVSRPDWTDRAFDATLSQDVDALFAERSRDEWDALLRSADCCGEPVLELAELRRHPFFAGHFVGELLRTFPALTPTESLPTRRAPARGEHTAEVLREWSSGRTAVDTPSSRD
jgi:crotonobetainyl-CoA:carnitine CoA-transferase CaiB-like acyl-CoA transferase